MNSVNFVYVHKSRRLPSGIVWVLPNSISMRNEVQQVEQNVDQFKGREIWNALHVLQWLVQWLWTLFVMGKVYQILEVKMLESWYLRWRINWTVLKILETNLDGVKDNMLILLFKNNWIINYLGIKYLQ